MSRLIRLFSSSIGQKLVVAVTGLILAGFLVGHMLGNMAIYQGQDALNGYADWLQGHPVVLVLRLGLFAIFVIHLSTALRLARRNRHARPARYSRKQNVAAAYSSQYIVVTGVMVLAFVVYHLLHFTLGVVTPDSYDVIDGEGRHDVYRMVVLGFQTPWIAASYIIAMFLVGLHLHHGLTSLFQTLGVNHDSYNGLIHVGANVVVAVLVLGNCSIPIMVLTGVVRLPAGG